MTWCPGSRSGASRFATRSRMVCLTGTVSTGMCSGATGLSETKGQTEASPSTCSWDATKTADSARNSAATCSATTWSAECCLRSSRVSIAPRRRSPLCSTRAAETYPRCSRWSWSCWAPIRCQPSQRLAWRAGKRGARDRAFWRRTTPARTATSRSSRRTIVAPPRRLCLSSGGSSD